MKSLLLFVFGLFVYLFSYIPAQAQSCTCNVGYSCGPITNTCYAGYQATCVRDPYAGTQCIGACNCVPIPSVCCVARSSTSAACTSYSSNFNSCVNPTDSLNCLWTCEIPPSTTANCCVGSSQCTYITGATYPNYLVCKNAGCSWNTACGAIPVPTPIPTRPPARAYCNLGNPSDRSARPDATHKGISTDLGCIPYEARDFIGGSLRWGVSIGGGIALLILGYAAFLYVASGGDPKKIQSAKELIVALIGGIILIVFSVLLLNYLGVNLLNLNGVGFRF